MGKIYISQYELKHYASPYYDPQKAHEYYEEHKKLKGKTAGRTLTDTGKEAKLYVSDQIKNAKKAASEKAQADREQAKSDRDNALEVNKSAHIREMDQLQNELLSMSKEELKRKGPMYKKKIANLKKQNSEAKAKAKQEYSDKIKSIRENNKAKQEELSNTLKAELERMLLDPETSKASGKSSTSGNVRPSDKATQERIKNKVGVIKKNLKTTSETNKDNSPDVSSQDRIKKNTERMKKNKEEKSK